MDDLHANSSTLTFLPPINNTAFFRNSSMTFNSSTHRKHQSSNNTTVIAIRTIIAVVGTIGNLCLLAAAWKDRTSRAGTRVLIINLAASSFLFVAPGQAVMMVYLYSPLANPCPFFIFDTILATAANWSDVSLAFNRMIAVCYPHHYRRVSSCKAGGLICAVTWLLSGLIVGLSASGFGSWFKEVRPGLCLPVAASPLGTFWTMAMTPIPIAVFGLIILRITVTFVAERKTGNRLAPVNVPSAASKQKGTDRKKALARAMIASFAWCFCSTVPYLVIASFIPTFTARYPVALEALRLVFISEYAINPVNFSCIII